VSRQELDDGLIVDFKGAGGEVQQIKCSWMVGTDGKKGVVRKKFLEPTANIKQEVGLSSYSATWVAANLKIRLPTPGRTQTSLCGRSDLL
jgi:2-polyprenyl-6-methoxyphenol hydroxylase-like FAD-dependent oxidoreductase